VKILQKVLGELLFFDSHCTAVHKQKTCAVVNSSSVLTYEEQKFKQQHESNVKPWVLPVVTSAHDAMFSRAVYSASVQWTGTLSTHLLPATGLLSTLLFKSLTKKPWPLNSRALQKLLKLFSEPFSKYRKIHSLRSHSIRTSYNCKHLAYYTWPIVLSTQWVTW